MRAAWIAVACAEHVRRGREGGFMQVCHGKAVPLRRIQPGDGVAYYSPTRELGGCRGGTKTRPRPRHLQSHSTNWLQLRVLR